MFRRWLLVLAAVLGLALLASAWQEIRYQGAVGVVSKELDFCRKALEVPDGRVALGCYAPTHASARADSIRIRRGNTNGVTAIVALALAFCSVGRFIYKGTWLK